MSKSSDSNNVKHEITLEELQKKIPVREKDLIHWTKQKQNGFYITAIGIAITVGTWMLTNGFADNHKVDQSFQFPLFSIVAMIFGSVIAVTGALVWTKNQMEIRKSYREFDLAMMAILKNAKTKSQP